MSCRRDNIQLECHTKSKQLVFQVTHTDDSEDQVKPPSPNEVIILIPKLDLDPAANGRRYVPVNKIQLHPNHYLSPADSLLKISALYHLPNDPETNPAMTIIHPILKITQVLRLPRKNPKVVLYINYMYYTIDSDIISYRKKASQEINNCDTKFRLKPEWQQWHIRATCSTQDEAIQAKERSDLIVNFSYGNFNS